MATPYYEDDTVTLYLSNYIELADMNITADAVITDPPYGETSLEWDRWQSGWPTVMSGIAPALWCFGSFRMFMENLADFDPWKFSHEIVWEKHMGSGMNIDRFVRVHELATFWYSGTWGDLRRQVPRVVSDSPRRGKISKSSAPSPHRGKMGARDWEDDGTRLQKSVIKVRSTHGHAVHPTQKPVGIVTPLIEYSVPVDGLVVDPFAGSGTTLLAAKLSGRRAIGFEVNEKYAEAAARRLSQQTFDLDGIA